MKFIGKDEGLQISINLTFNFTKLLLSYALLLFGVGLFLKDDFISLIASILATIGVYALLGIIFAYESKKEASDIPEIIFIPMRIWAELYEKIGDDIVEFITH